MKLSIVATLYQSAPHILEFHLRASAAAKKLVGEDYEIVLVNDGSPDKSLDIAVQLTLNDSHVFVVDLSRNFGHHKAMMTGLAHTQGDRIFLIDSDLEEEPEWLIAFTRKMDIFDCDVIYGVQKNRKGGWFERWTGSCYYQIINFLSGMVLPPNMVTARLMTRRYVESLLLHQERELDIGGLWLITGYLQIPYEVIKHSTSETTYTFIRKISLLVNSVTSFSSFPLMLIFYIGALISLGSAFNITFIIVQWYLSSMPLEGWTSIIASIWLLGGFILLSIGVVGVYLSKIFEEVKGRPYTIVRKIYGIKEGNYDSRKCIK
jgi:putative glycosyltransferase